MALAVDLVGSEAAHLHGDDDVTEVEQLPTDVVHLTALVERRLDGLSMPMQDHDHVLADGLISKRGEHQEWNQRSIDERLQAVFLDPNAVDDRIANQDGWGGQRESGPEPERGL